MKNRIIAALILLIAAFAMVACDQESRVASYNVSMAAHNFEVNRRAIFYNGITGEYILVIEGLLSVENNGGRLEVIVKTGPREYKKHYLGLSDNVTYFVEQLDPVQADPFHYRVIFRPPTLLPSIEVKTH